MLTNLANARARFFLDADGGGKPAGVPDGDDKKKITFTDEQQEVINALIGERAKRAGESAVSELLTKLGLKSADDLAGIIAAAKQAEADKLSEVERLQKQITDMQTERDTAKNEAATRVEQASTRVLNTEIKIAASQPALDKDGKVLRPAFRADALADVILLVDRKTIKEVEGGEFEGIADALTALAKAKPYLMADAGKQETAKTPGSPRPGAKNNRTEQKQEQTEAPAKPPLRF